ncbi:MAG TPA: hypothetical protein VMU95_41275 [Trebonia sp.]|nr:hypothetical protein [Trebonia sp.]
MTVTPHVFPQFAIGLGTGNINLTSGTYKVALSNAAGPITLATSGVSTAKLLTDWTTNVAAEITGTGYTAGGATVSSPTFVAGGSNNSVATWTSASNPSWSAATFSANQAIFYESSASTYQLICFWDFGGSVPVSANTFTLTISGSGLLTATAS